MFFFKQRTKIGESSWICHYSFCVTSGSQLLRNGCLNRHRVLQKNSVHFIFKLAASPSLPQTGFTKRNLTNVGTIVASVVWRLGRCKYIAYSCEEKENRSCLKLNILLLCLQPKNCSLKLVQLEVKFPGDAEQSDTPQSVFTSKLRRVQIQQQLVKKNSLNMFPA